MAVTMGAVTENGSVTETDRVREIILTVADPDLEMSKIEAAVGATMHLLHPENPETTLEGTAENIVQAALMNAWFPNGEPITSVEYQDIARLDAKVAVRVLRKAGLLKARKSGTVE